jgi:hypothetical protein
MAAAAIVFFEGVHLDWREEPILRASEEAMDQWSSASNRYVRANDTGSAAQAHVPWIAAGEMQQTSGTGRHGQVT